MRAFAHRVPLVALPLLLVAATGCIAATDEPMVPCECPNTEAIVLSIDWLGNGRSATSHESTRRGPVGEELPGMDLAFLEFESVEDGTRALAKLHRRIEEGGLPVEGIGTVRLEMAQVVIDSPAHAVSGEPPRRVILIRVDIYVEDELAAPALQPLVDALGTVDQ